MLISSSKLLVARAWDQNILGSPKLLRAISVFFFVFKFRIL